MKLSDKALEAAEELKTTDPYDKTEGRIEKTLRECAEALDAKQAQIDAMGDTLSKRETMFDDCIEACEKQALKVADLEKELRKCKDALEEIAEWPRRPGGPNYSIKYIAKTALNQLEGEDK